MYFVAEQTERRTNRDEVSGDRDGVRHDFLFVKSHIEYTNFNLHADNFVITFWFLL